MKPTPIHARDVHTWGRRVALALSLGVASGALAMTPGAEFLARLGIDFLLPARDWFSGPLFPPSDSDVVVVAIDEETYRTAPFAETPRVAWTPMVARVLDAVDGGGAAVIGLDLINPTSLDQPALLPGYDKPLLKSLFKIGRQGRLLLGEARLSQQSIRPYKGQLTAVGGGQNVRPLNLLIDIDEIVRRYRAGVVYEGGRRDTSFAVELVRRAGGAPPVEDFLINFNTGPNDIPTYSVADLYACAEAGNDAYFARQFRGKIVIFGVVLDVEDRHVAANRLATARLDVAPVDRCVIPFDSEKFGQIIDRRSIPGVYIHAAAANTLSKGIGLKLLSAARSFGVVTVSTAGLILLFFVLPPIAGLGFGLCVLLAEIGLSVIAFSRGIVPPIGAVALAGILAFTLIYAFRFMVEDKAKRRIQHAFRHYLAPVLVDQLADNADALTLGGETRRVTVFFSDIVGYTSLSEGLKQQPEKLVDVVNQYFTLVSGVVEARGGYIDKFMGDAVMSFWNAPLDDEDHARHAIDAALDCLARLEDFNRDVVEGKFGLCPIGTRIGINTGTAVVGNMGSTSRLNYTVTGDTVNLAARLESANKTYGSHLMIGEGTRRSLDESYVLRRLDRLVVTGKTQPVRVYEVFGRQGEVDTAVTERIAAFQTALAQYYRRNFAEARDAFAALADGDDTALLYVDRCTHYLAEPPLANWDRAFVAKTK